MNTYISSYTLKQTIIFLKRSDFMFERVPEIMTFKECQKLLKVGKNTLLDLIHNGEIEAFKIGNRWKIPRNCVLEFLKYK